jgi:hypothetical protein
MHPTGAFITDTPFGSHTILVLPHFSNKTAVATEHIQQTPALVIPVTEPRLSVAEAGRPVAELVEATG